MIKQLLFSFITIILCSSILRSQNYASLVKENVYWDVLEGNSQNLYIYDGGSRYFFDGDTLIGNQLYSKLFYHPFNAVYNPYPSFYVDTSTVIFSNYIREDTSARKTYILEPWNPNEVLMFDFSLNIGDTLNSTYTTDGTPIVVNTITNEILLNGAIRKKWTFDNGHFYIEGIGSSQGFFSPTFTLLGAWLETNCVNDNNVHLYGNRCFTILGLSEAQVSDSALKVYPNPVKDRLIVEGAIANPVDFKLYNLYGQIILTKKLSSSVVEIDVSNLPKGMYMLSIHGEDSQKIIKQ